MVLNESDLNTTTQNLPESQLEIIKEEQEASEASNEQNQVKSDENESNYLNQIRNLSKILLKINIKCHC